MTDNVPPHTGVIEKGGLTNDPRPTVSGRGDPGATIHILVDGVQVGTAVVGANGTWSFALTQRLSDGEYRLTARASNEIGMSVPSASYGIQLDTTPPSQPKIDAATEGTQPMLSGQAEAYSTVTIYDGATVLGTVKTGIDGTWTFQLPSGLSNGKHALTVTAQDPAGNTSVRSEGFDVTIGSVTPPSPLAKALLDDMGRDSGNFNFDRLTNDGTAGRLLSGHVVGVLAAGQKVQVSTDGGRTWIDALMKSDGTWVAIDPNTHTGNWSIQTRVVNDSGVSSEVQSVDVALKTSVPVPTGVFLQGEVLTVKFAGTLVEVGSRLAILIDGHMYTHELTKEEISAGSATFPTPRAIADSLAVAIVDMAGNISLYRSAEGVIKYVENFDATPSASLNLTGEKTSTKYFDLTCLEGQTNSYWKQGLYKGADMAKPGEAKITDPSETMALSIVGRVRLDLRDGLSATRITFDAGDLTREEKLCLYFYDKNGELIYKSQPISASGGVHQRVEIDVGKEFVRVEFNQEWRSDWYTLTWIDNLEFSKTATHEGVFDPPAVQDLLDDVSYHGGYGKTIFNVDNVSYFAGEKSGVHGGLAVDTLKLKGASQYLDVTSLNSGFSEKITGIEIFDITGTGNNILKLSMKDVLNLGHEDLFRTDGHTQLMVKGDTGDRVELSGMSGLADGQGQWVKQGLITHDGLAYMLYENAALNVELLVQASVSVQLI
ncbi:Ig-like domain-containing protein [Burkholderia cenocepacia]|uniref:Ig-like domain-containing protein n=1 Tax=Burkholderia cenocepacia TaxID=95486 RepID=UPI001CF2F0B4|nr:Ig-like domain-containing protein [Burkholderia cenocepacia]MCA8238736.1 Ig-like domain-containing protein [Burkholderia cenocepacia]